MWVARTRQLHASHISVFDRIWSNLPFLRPIATITGDSLKDYGIDSDGRVPFMPHHCHGCQLMASSAVVAVQEGGCMTCSGHAATRT